MRKETTVFKGCKDFAKEWDKTVESLRKYFSSDKSTVKENGGKSGQNEQN